MASNRSSNDSYIWISYSDLMTTVTFAFIFLLMAILAANQAMQAELKSAEQTIHDSKIRVGDLVQTRASVGSVLESLKQQIESVKECQNVLWTVDQANTSIRANFTSERDGWFQEGKSELSPSAESCLGTFAVILLTKLYDDKFIRRNLQNLIIEGHTNSRPIKSLDSSYLDNLLLSQMRAFNASKFILERISRSRFILEPPGRRDWDSFMEWRNSKLTATGRSFSDVLMKNNSKDEDFDKSKRIEFRCLIKNDFSAMKTLLAAPNGAK